MKGYFEGEKHGLSPSLLVTNSTLNPILFCPICKLIIWKPKVCSQPECRTTFCSPCINTLKDSTCPKCKKRSEFKSNSIMVSEYLSNLEFKCEKSPECKEIFKYENIDKHICEHLIVDCSKQGCNWRGKCSLLEGHKSSCEHTASVCINRVLGCIWTGKKIALNEHLSNCAYAETYCIHGCGKRDLRTNLGEHEENICENRIVSCLYKEKGCQDHPKKQFFYNHIDFCQFKPLELECHHVISQKDREEHIIHCLDYPIRCTKCSTILTRGEEARHNCISYLLTHCYDLLADKIKHQEHIRENEDKIRDLKDILEKERNESAEYKISLAKAKGKSSQIEDIRQILNKKLGGIVKKGRSGASPSQRINTNKIKRQPFSRSSTLGVSTSLEAFSSSKGKFFK